MCRSGIWRRWLAAVLRQDSLPADWLFLKAPPPHSTNEIFLRTSRRDETLFYLTVHTGQSSSSVYVNVCVLLTFLWSFWMRVIVDSYHPDFSERELEVLLQAQYLRSFSLCVCVTCVLASSQTKCLWHFVRLTYSFHPQFPSKHRVFIHQHPVSSLSRFFVSVSCVFECHYCP